MGRGLTLGVLWAGGGVPVILKLHRVPSYPQGFSAQAVRSSSKELTPLEYRRRTTGIPGESFPPSNMLEQPDRPPPRLGRGGGGRGGCVQSLFSESRGGSRTGGRRKGGELGRSQEAPRGSRRDAGARPGEEAVCTPCTRRAVPWEEQEP